VTISITPDGKWVYTGSFDRNFKRLNLKERIDRGYNFQKTIDCRNTTVRSTNFSSDGKFLAVGLRDQIRLYLPSKGKLMWKRNLNSCGLIRGVCFSTDNRHVFAGCDGRKIIKINILTRKITLVNNAHESLYYNRTQWIRKSNDGKYLYTLGWVDNKIKKWTSDTLEKVWTLNIQNPYAHTYNYMLLDKTSRYAYIGDSYGTLQVYDLKYKCLHKDYGKLCNRGIICLAMDHSNQNLFIGLADGS